MIVRTMMNMMQKIIDYGGKDDSGNGTCSPFDNAYPSYETNRKRNDSCHGELKIKSTCGNATTNTYVASK